MPAFLLIIFIFIGFGTIEFSGKITTVTDGNTLEVLNAEKETIIILLDQVDCPEPGQPYAESAREFTEKLVLRKKLHIVIQGKDRWGNKLATVELKNGTSLNHELVRNGLAWAVPAAGKEVLRLQEEAKTKKTGLWQNEDPTPPWVYRRQQTMMAPKSR